METQMKINGDKVRALREEKSWSQEHLASAAGLSVRTVQRVESENVGSLETRLALAAALDVQVSTLIPDTSTANRKGVARWPSAAWTGWGVGAVCACTAVALEYVSTKDVSAAMRSLGVISALLASTCGAMSAVNGMFRSRQSAN